METVALVDRTASTRAHKLDPAEVPDWSTQVVDNLVDVYDEPNARLISAGAFDGAQAGVSWEVARVELPVAVGTDKRLLADSNDARQCLATLVRKALTSAPKVEGTDVLGAWAAAKERLAGSHARRLRIVVRTDGLATVGCADLRTTVIGDQDEWARVVKACQASNELPDLAGVELVMLGVGHPGPGHQVPKGAQPVWLKRYWEQLCEAAGARRCRIETNAPREKEAPTPTVGTGDPPVEFPEIVVDQEDEEHVITIPASVLFATESATLSDKAIDALDEAVEQIRKSNPIEVRVKGHTDSRGDDEVFTQRLSQARADAVRDVLVRAGINPVEAIGRGEKEPKCEEFLNGEPDHAAMACNRRVEIFVVTTR